MHKIYRFELKTAGEMFLFDTLTHENSEYTTPFGGFLDNIYCDTSIQYVNANYDDNACKWNVDAEKPMIVDVCVIFNKYNYGSLFSTNDELIMHMKSSMLEFEKHISKIGHCIISTEEHYE